MKFQKPILLAFIALIVLGVGESRHATAQRGTSSTSMGVARAGIHRQDDVGRFVMPAANLFRVDEFVNYHEHELPLPVGDDRVRLEVQGGMDVGKGESVIQFGITTPRELNSETMQPLNIVLVVDESGSMGGKKIENLKHAVQKMVERFRKSDRVAIVGFNNSARVILPATKKTKVNRISAAIDSIRSNGGTNLHAGLMLGYEEALKSYDAERANRVIFLTDGNANVGETESNEIARKSNECIDLGISLVTIGLGVDFNHGLLRELADSGRGVMHFINDAKDIEKTFVDEVESLLAPAAQQVKLKVKFDGLDESPKVYGYKAQMKRKSESRFVFKLDDLNYGATQVVLAKFSADEILGGTAQLKYVDAITKEKIELKVDLSEIECCDHSDSVAQNCAIAFVADSLHAAAQESNEGNCGKAERILKRGIAKAERLVNLNDDRHVQRVVKIATEYRNEISRSRKLLSKRD